MNYVHFFIKRLEKAKTIIYNNNMANVSINSISIKNVDKTKTLSLKQSFAEILANMFRNEFKSVHLSGQLLRSIRIESDGDGNYKIEIPPQIYDIAKFRKNGVVVFTSQNSYAAKVNVTGGFSGKHVNYVEKCIVAAFIKWQQVNGLNPSKLKFDATLYN